MSHAAAPAEPQLVPAVFPSLEGAEAAVAQLRDIGVADTDIGMAVPIPGRQQQSPPSDAETFAIAGQSAAKGASIGTITGIGLLSVAGGGALALGVGGLLAAGMGGLVWGGVIGGLLGVITRVRRDPDHDRWCEVELHGDEVLLVVRVRDWTHEDRIAAVMSGSGARCVLDELGQDKTWDQLELEHPSSPSPSPFTPGAKP